MRRETKLWIYLHVTWRMPPWITWSDSPRAGAAPSRGGAGHQARAGSGLHTEITLSRWLTDSIFTQSTVYSLRLRRRGYYYSLFRHGTWQVSLIPSSGWLCLNWLCGGGAVSCQETLQLSVWQIQIAQCPDSGTRTQLSQVPAYTGLCCYIDASISRYIGERTDGCKTKVFQNRHV